MTFTFDARHRLATTTTDGTVGPQPAVTLSYAYDRLDRRVSMSDSLGGVTGYAWDGKDRLTGLTAPWGTAWTFGYDGEGRRVSLASSTGRATTYGYANGLLSALRHVQAGVSDLVPDQQTTGSGTPTWHLAMAATLVVMLPPIAIVIFMQRWFVRGLINTDK